MAETVDIQETKETTRDGVVLTDKAITEVGKIREEQSIPEGFYLRMGVKGGGCSGFSYALAFDENLNEL